MSITAAGEREFQRGNVRGTFGQIVTPVNPGFMVSQRFPRRINRLLYLTKRGLPIINYAHVCFIVKTLYYRNKLLNGV